MNSRTRNLRSTGGADRGEGGSNHQEPVSTERLGNQISLLSDVIYSSPGFGISSPSITSCVPVL